jgi:hypothetical protein
VTYGPGMTKRPRQTRVISPLFDMTKRLEANRGSQADLHRVIAGLGVGIPRSEADWHLNALRTELLALNMEMNMRATQVTGNA